MNDTMNDTALPLTEDTSGTIDAAASPEPPTDTLPDTETRSDGETAPITPSLGCADDAVYRPVYKGQVYEIAASDRDEITTLLQLGMKQRETAPLMEELKDLAAACGAKSIKELITVSRQTLEQEALAEAIAMYGEENGRRFYENAKAARARAVTEAPDKTVEDRLCEEFLAAKAVYTQYDTFDKVPTEAIEAVLHENISLREALGRLESDNAKARRDETRMREAREAATVGALGSGVTEDGDAVMRAFVKGLSSRL